MRRLSCSLRPVAWFLVALAVSGSLARVAVSAAPRPTRHTLAQAIQLQKRHSPRLLSLENVVGTATGVDRNGRLAIKVYARKPGNVNVPEELDGMPIIVEATGEFYALQGPRPHHRPPIRHGWRPPERRPPEWRRDRDRDRKPPEEQDFAPTVAIVTPENGEVVTGDILVTAIAEDDGGVDSLAFYVDDVLLGIDFDGTDGWTQAWDSTLVNDGSHTLTAEATDSIGQTSEDSVDVLVDNEEGPFSPDGRPAPIGVSTGNGNECSAGTIACRVQDVHGNIYALSNNHVYARLNDAGVGEQILQPGLFDTDCQIVYSDQVIGVLADFVPLVFGPSGTNRVDAAIALTSTDFLGDATPADGYGRPKSAPVTAYVGQLVQKYGRTTLLTDGAVSGIEATVIVNYGDRTARFTNQIIVESAQPFIDSGDSGSLLVTYDPDPASDGGRSPVGLLYAGSADGSTAIANPIQEVLDALEVTIDGQ